MTNPIEKILENELFKITQEADLKQFVHSSKSKQNIQAPIMINIVGDSAITKAVAPNATAKELMRLLLEQLPDPKVIWLRALAIAISLENHNGNKRATSKALGVAERTLWPEYLGGSWMDRIDAINTGQIEFKPQREDSG